MKQEKILKIAKGLGIFTLDDIIVMTGFDESEATGLLEGLAQEKVIEKLSNDKYRYIGKIPERREIFRLIEKPDKKINKGDDITFKQAVEYFLTNHAIQNCTPSTFKTYISITKVHFIPFFGKISLKNIAQKEIKDFIELKQRQNLSDRRIRNCVTLLGNIFNKLKEWGFISENPYNGILNVSCNRKSEIRVLSETETVNLLKMAKNKYPKLYPLILLAVLAGLKRAEILALQKKDIDLKNRKINISKIFYEGKTFIPRFKSIIRQIDIPNTVLIVLKRIVKDKTDDDFIFYNPKSGAFKTDRQMRKQLASLLNELDIDKMTFNELRHTYASNALQKGISIDYLHKQLGEYSIQATMDKYKGCIPH